MRWGSRPLWAFGLLFVLHSCFLSRPERAPEPGEKVRLQVYYAMGPEEGPGKRVELWVEPAAKGGYQVFFRSTPGKKTWLPLWDASYLAALPLKKVQAYLDLLERVDFFSLPPLLEVSDEGKGDALLLRVRLGTRLHQVVARGKPLPPLTRCLEGLEALTGARLPLPSWYPRLDSRKRAGVELVPDPERSYLLHKRWLAGKEIPTGRLLDLFALELKTGRREEARRLLKRFERLPSAAGLLPGLRAAAGY